MINPTFNIVENFVSLDGEGTRAGQPTIFIRLAGCNLQCSFCDSKYSWNCDDAVHMTLNDLMTQVKTLSDEWVKNITVTGGEPLISPDVDTLLLSLCDEGYNVNVETNGTISPRVHHPNLFYTIDYKCKFSGMNDYMNMDIYKNLTDKDIVKFVVANDDDMNDTLKIIKQYPYIKYYYSPVFGEIELEQIANFIINNHLYNAQLQVQLHKLVWDPEMRGV